MTRMQADSTPTVLIVDDNPNNLRVLEGILHTAGYKVRPALNGDTALRAAASTLPDLILLDIRMPVMDGFEVCRQLKARSETRDIPVIFISALQEMDDKVQAFKAGGIDYIVKPFQGEEVLTRAHTHIELGRARSTLARSNERLEELVAERTRELSATNDRLAQAMREEHALRELLALSHHHFADQDYPSRALASLNENVGWHPHIRSAILSVAAIDGQRLLLSASHGYTPSQEAAMAAMTLSSCNRANGQFCLKRDTNESCTRIHDILGLGANDSSLCLPLTSGDRIFGLMILASGVPDAFNPMPFLLQVAEVLAMGIARRQADEQLAWQAYHDELTHLPNRRQLEEELPREMRNADRHANYCGILLIDLDHFKLLNDALGHNIGDQFIKEVAKRVRQTVRASDLVFRWGGDEFIVLLPAIGQDEEESVTHARAAAEKIAQSLVEPMRAGEQSVHINASMGITLYPCDGATSEELLMHVDLAMHKAKQAGRNSVHFFQPEMQSDAEHRLSLEKELREALKEQQFLLHYQAQVDDNGRLIGAESLVRWRHPAYGLVPPGRFIPIAEDSGLILPLGDWVLETACRQLRGWSEGAPPPGRLLAVNVSAQQFHQTDFIDRVRRVLELTNAPPGALELEVTESLLLADIDGAVQKMGCLRDLGIRFSVDDFGTGYSSLAYLKRLPVDQLKIDRSFVHEVHKDGRNASIVRTIISLAHNLDMEVIAEGVEEAAEFAFLREAGCRQFQGFYFSKPLPVEAFDQQWPWRG